jgi:DNA-binding IclR family transcriptional regulator
MPDEKFEFEPPRLAEKAEAVLGAVGAGLQSVPEIAAVTGIAPTNVIRVAALLRDRGLVATCFEAGRLTLLPAFDA